MKPPLGRTSSRRNFVALPDKASNLKTREQRLKDTYAADGIVIGVFFGFLSGPDGIVIEVFCRSLSGPSIRLLGVTSSGHALALGVNVTVDTQHADPAETHLFSFCIPSFLLWAGIMGNPTDNEKNQRCRYGSGDRT